MTQREVEIVEVSPRDGLQAEDVVLGTDAKVQLIGRAVAAGIRRVEVCSFVHAERVPQMADAEAVLAALPQVEGVTYVGLVLNRRGFERAADAGMDEINYVVIASDTFSQRNQGMSTDASLDSFEEIATMAASAGIRPTVTIGASFGCPYEGEVAIDRVVSVADRVAAAGAAEVSLADTIGVGVPSQVTERLGAVRSLLPAGVALRAHFHNTRNTGIANAYAALEAGVDALDASLGGIGGCPFAPNATGNIPTEDLVYMLERMGVATGVDLTALAESVPWVEQQLGKPVPGLVSKAGLFPAGA